MVYNLLMDSEEENPWGILKSLDDGYWWLSKLEREAIEILYDLVQHNDTLSESSKTALEYSVHKTKEAIEIISIEMKMFKE